MPVTARLSRKFYDTFGDEIANVLVDWFNKVDAAYRSELRELNELNFARFDAKVEQRIAEVKAEVRTRSRRTSSQPRGTPRRSHQVDVHLLGRHDDDRARHDARPAQVLVGSPWLSPEVPQVVIQHPRHHACAVLGARPDVVDGSDILSDGGQEGFRGCDGGAGLEQSLDRGAAADGGRDARGHHPPAGAGARDGQTDLRDRLGAPRSDLLEHLVGIAAARDPDP